MNDDEIPAEFRAAAPLVDIIGGTADVGAPFFPLIRLEILGHTSGSLPPELAALAPIKPDSRTL